MALKNYDFVGSVTSTPTSAKNVSGTKSTFASLVDSIAKADSVNNQRFADTYITPNIPAAKGALQSFASTAEKVLTTPVSDITSGIKNAVGGAVAAVKDGLSNAGNAISNLVGNGADSLTQGNYVSVPSDGGTSVVLPEYINADLAKAYGMDASTAYQEALSNTSYQRAMTDLQAAGLNPLLAVGSGSMGANGVYSAHLAGSGNGANTVSTGVSSAKGAHTYYSLLSNLGTAVGAITKGRVGAIAGNAIGTIIGNALDNR